MIRDTLGRFIAGQHAALRTEFRRGEHRSRATEFQPGATARNRLPVGTVRVRIETRTRSPRAWVKTAEPNVWRKRAVVAWESVHGPLAQGLIVHHVDRDTLNDAPENLSALTRSEHTDEHRRELVAAMARVFLDGERGAA